MWSSYLDEVTDIMGLKEGIDLVLAAATFMCCLYVMAAMSWWVYTLRRQFWRSPLAWFFFSIILAKAAIADWALVNVIAMLSEGKYPPIYTLRPRILIMLSIFIQIATTVALYRRRPRR